MTKNSIHYGAGGTLFTGDAVKVLQAAAIASGLGLLAVGIKPNRAWTLKNALAKASEFTGEVYKGKKDVEKARADLKIWIDAAKAITPITRD